MHPSAPTIMSASPSIDAYDAQMLDFSSDPDVTMNITGSAEFFTESLMDHDSHVATPSYGDHPSVEVDMEEYVGDNAEYEMADETAEYHRSHGDELLDIEVYDASHVPSPHVPLQPLQPSVDVPIDSEHPEPTPPASSEQATLPEFQDKPESEVHPAPLDHPASDVPHVESSASGEGVPLDVVSSELAHPTEVPADSTLPASESREQLGDAASANEQPLETPAAADEADGVEPHVPPVAEEHFTDLNVTQAEAPELSAAESTALVATEAYNGGRPPLQDEKAADQAAVTEGEAADPLHISDGVYIDPPPAVLLSIADLSQPEFVLFNQSHVEGEGENRQAYESLLLENRPTLYYEPLSNVFEALRQDEVLLSRVPHSFEGELVLDAFDLQLAVTEDNVHSREISLHDLNVLHDGSDFVGPLRLHFRALVPRFIMRYYALQEQIQRLNVADETGEGELEEERPEQYDTGEEQHVLQQEEAVTSLHAAVVSDSSEVPAAAEAEEEQAKEPIYPPEATEEAPQENNETEETSGVQDFAAEYHEVTGEATHTLEDEDDYEGTNTGDEDESAKSESLDGDQVHVTAAEDTDAPATVTGQELEFGGEQTGYLDYVQPEEYDEHYSEDLLERAGGGASPVQYGEPPHYEGDGEQDTLIAADETQVILPGEQEEEEEEEDKSAATPIPARAVLEAEMVEQGNGLTLSEQDDAVLSREQGTIGESVNEVDHTEQTSSNSKSTDAAQAKIFSEVEESDSNFVSMLEREANTELERTFNGEQKEQEGSIEANLQHDLSWDEWDDEDAEGEDEEDWIDPDAASNESSITLSSKASSKRSHDEVEPSEEAYLEDPHTSPGKRPRVQ